MQPVYSSRREAGPFLNVMLILVIVAAILGVVTLGIGAKIGDDLSAAKSYGSAFWWGGLVILLLAGLYLPCHFLVKSGNPAGRGLFFLWTFFIVIGVICILVSALLSGLVYAFVSGMDAGHCTYTAGNGNWTAPTSPCHDKCKNYFGTPAPERTCCCCLNDDTDDTIFYIKDVDSCSVFSTSKNLAGALTYIYVISVILLFVLMVMAYVVACGCCAIQQPWVTYTVVTSTTDAPVYGATAGKY